MKIGIVILAVTIAASSARSFAYSHHPSDAKTKAQANWAAPALEQFHEAPERHAGPSPGSETVVVDLPFRSREIDSSMAEYLNLTPRQVKAVEHLVEQERRELEPLLAQLQSMHEKLLAAEARDQSSETEVLAAAEERILTRLMIESARTEVRFQRLLTHEQQRRFEDLDRSKR